MMSLLPWLIMGRWKKLILLTVKLRGKLKDETKFESFNVESDDALTQRL